MYNDETGAVNVTSGRRVCWLSDQQQSFGGGGGRKRARSNDVNSTVRVQPRAKRKCGLCGEEGKFIIHSRNTYLAVFICL